MAKTGLMRTTSQELIRKGRRWYLRCLHWPTGIPMAEELCTNFRTREEGRVYMRARINEAKSDAAIDDAWPK